jgi:hypothetical protein
MTKDNSNSQDLLNDAIREASGEAAMPRHTHARPDTPRKLSIEDVLQEQHAAPPSTVRTAGAPHSAVRRPVDTSLDAALAKVGAGDTAPHGLAAAPLRSGAVTADSLATTLAGMGTPMPVSDSITAGEARKRIIQRMLGLILLLITLFAAGYYWWLPAPPKPVGPAAILNNLATAIEQHKSQHSGQLPVSLSTMASFPKGAVEWPLHYWNARDAAGRTEIIWVPRGQQYSLLLRQGKEAWIVSDREPKPKQIAVAKP